MTIVVDVRLDLYPLMMELAKKLQLRLKQHWQAAKPFILIPMDVISLNGYVKQVEKLFSSHTATEILNMMSCYNKLIIQIFTGSRL